MNKLLGMLLVVWFLVTALTGMAGAQDLILKTTGEELSVKITEVTPADILYKKADSLAGRTYALPRKDVFLVKYGNGDKEVFAAAPADQAPADYFEKGRQDARQYYKGNGAKWGSAGSMFLLSVYGPIIMAVVPPKINPAQVSDIRLLRHPEYVQGYTRQAHKRKVGKVAAGAGIGLAALTVVLTVVLGSYQ
jgi:hypothetical protein